MVRLRDDKEHLSGQSLNAIQSKKIPTNHQEISRLKTMGHIVDDDVDDGSVDLNKFSQSVLRQLLNDSIQATPENFDIYFRKLLENKSPAFQKKVLEIIDYSKNDGLDQQAMIEKEVKLGFSEIKNMLQVITLIYKNLVIMKSIVRKRLEEAKTSSNPIEIKAAIRSFSDELDKLSSLMDRHLDVIKISYEDVNKIFKRVDEQSIYDSKFGVYNKKYFLKNLEDELGHIQRYNYNVTVMFIHVKDAVLNSIKNLKDKNGILKNIAKILLKTSRRSDIVAHYGDGYFGMIMKHTDMEAAKKACERVGQMLYQTTFFIGEDELDIDIEISVAAITANLSIEETLSICLDALSKSGKKYKLYEVAKNE